MKIDPGLRSKGGPGSRQDHSRSGQPGRGRQPPLCTDPDPSSRNRTNATTRAWASSREALKGIDQSLVSKRKEAQASCWRYGRGNHHTTEYFAIKDIEGNNLPPVPVPVLKATVTTAANMNVAPATSARRRRLLNFQPRRPR